MLEYEPLPWCLRGLWSHFKVLSGTRAAGMGISPISFTEIQSWCWLNGIQLNPWEVDMVLAMDNVATNIMMDKPKPKTEEK